MTAIRQVTEDQMINLVRNALLVAGEEMGAEGDHWPVIKSTIHDIMKDYEDLKIEQNVHQELKIQLTALLNEMDENLKTCPADIKPAVEEKLKQLHELHDAYFSSIDKTSLRLSDDEKPVYLKRAEILIDTLEDDND